MSRLELLVSPDLNAAQVPHWYLFDTLLQRALGRAIHLTIPESFENFRGLLSRHEVDLVYANAFDSSWLVRDRGWIPVARPRLRSDEATLAVVKDHPANSIYELPRPMRVAATAAPDVARIARMLLEPATYAPHEMVVHEHPSYVVVARSLFRGQDDVGFFLSSSFDELSNLIRKDLKVIVQSHISVLRHAVLLAPRHRDLRQPLLDLLLAMGKDDRSAVSLEDLGLAGGFEELLLEETLFVADLMETLRD